MSVNVTRARSNVQDREIDGLEEGTLVSMEKVQSLRPDR